VKRIDEKISFIPCSENPLSADVYLISGDEYTYVVDVGSSDQAFEQLQAIDKKRIIITHFHDDHMKNLRRMEVEDKDLFLTEQTRKVLDAPVYKELYVKKGTLVTAPITLTDGIKITVIPVPSSHAKGSLGVITDEEYLFLGDSFYSSAKGYNVSLLYDEIRILKEMSFTKVIMSHDEKIYSREEIIGELESYYEKREKNNPFIQLR
jgi:glyoxylase-like metal-dependent hydrolase (beta-lactamase superfamily II)